MDRPAGNQSPTLMNESTSGYEFAGNFLRLRQAHATWLKSAKIDLAQRKAVIEQQDPFFRAALFGRHYQGNGSSYALTEALARALYEAEIDVLHGGGPENMHAAGAPAKDARVGGGAIVISVELGMVDQTLSGMANLSLSTHDFGDRLSLFYDLSAIGICTEGGRGTALEGDYFLQISAKAGIAWQVAREKAAQAGPDAKVERPDQRFLYCANPWVAMGYIPPVIYLGRKFWEGTRIQHETFLAEGTIKEPDYNNVYFVDTVDEVMEIVVKRRELFRAILAENGVQALN